MRRSRAMSLCVAGLAVLSCARVVAMADVKNVAEFNSLVLCRRPGSTEFEYWERQCAAGSWRVLAELRQHRACVVDSDCTAVIAFPVYGPCCTAVSKSYDNGINVQQLAIDLEEECLEGARTCNRSRCDDVRCVAGLCEGASVKAFGVIVDDCSWMKK